MSSRLNSSSQEFAKISVEQLEKELVAVTAGTAEEAEQARLQPTSDGGPAAGRAARPTPKLRRSISSPSNLTDQAKKGKIDPVLGRDAEIRQIIDILTRRRQNNPILTGEAGVGKTAVVEGFALRIAAGDVPDAAQERQSAHARPGPAAGRRRREGRIREPSEDP